MSLQVKTFRRRLLVLLVLVLLLCTACAENRKGEEAGGQEAEAAGGSEPGGEVGNGQSAEPAEEDRAGRVQLELDEPADRPEEADRRDARSAEGRNAAADAARAVPPGLSVLSNPDPFGLPGGEIVRDTPSDTTIGALQDRWSLSPAEEAVIRPAERFLERLLAMSPEDPRMDELLSEVAPERRSEMADWLRFSLERFPGPTGARLGELRRDDDSRAWMPVLLRREGARASGELHLSLGSGRWFVTDLLVQFGDLAEEGNEDLERFEPTEYPARSPGI